MTVQQLQMMRITRKAVTSLPVPLIRSALCPHSLPPPPGSAKEMMSAESCVAEPGPQEAPQPPRAVASLSVRVLPPPGPAHSSLPISQSAHDEDGEEEQGAALRRSGRGQPTWERSRRKPPAHPAPPARPPSPPLEPEPSFLLPDTPKQSPPVPASAPPMQAGGPAPLPGSLPEPEGGVEQGPPMPATLQEQPQTSTQPTESVPDTPPSALAPPPQVPPPKGGSAPCAATERAAAGAERVTLQGRGACVVPVLPPSPPPEDGDPSRAGARPSSSSPSSPSSLSSSTQEKLRPAHQGNTGLSPPYRRTGVVLEEGAASQKKKASPEKDVGDKERTHKPREVMEVEGPAEGAVRCMEKVVMRLLLPLMVSAHCHHCSTPSYSCAASIP
ncbi:hypothetical protein AGOR_G00187170 [Albula goreensis]|uniref:Uncharacterized protein n=1 Tax=Albula goreensis TaxID=1534307 RepID=A0A8T3CZ47_9TELE|nr:hypothetical protein AGOR_G00187170 [Albula goreensis]